MTSFFRDTFPQRLSPTPSLSRSLTTLCSMKRLAMAGWDTRTRLMVQLAAIIASQATIEFRMMLGAALAADVTPTEVKEIVYQAVPYVGIAKVIDFLRITNDVLTERGVALPLPSQSTTTPENRLEKGLAVQKGDHRCRARRKSL